jgi:hypothetical protein
MMEALHAAVILLVVSVGAPPQADITGAWEVAVQGGRGTMKFVLDVTRDRDTLAATMTAGNGEERGAAVVVDGRKVSVRFQLDNPGDPVRVVMTGTVDGDRMKGTADFGGRATAEWTAVRRKPRPHEQFWQHLRTLCDGAFAGKLVEAPPGDATFADKPLVMHVRECGAHEIRIPLHVGDDRSRTWVIRRTAFGLILKHDHRHADGTPDKVTQYGGDSRARPPAPTKLQFPADMETIALIPEAKTNVWTLEIEPGKSFAYALRREGTDRRFRIEFDTTRRVPTPPAPWGAR